MPAARASATWSDGIRLVLDAIESGNATGRTEIVELRRAIEELTAIQLRLLTELQILARNSEK